MKKINELFKPVNLTKGSVWKVIAGFSVPILISYLFQQIYTIADAAICGKFLSENQVAGVNNTGNIVFLVLPVRFRLYRGFFGDYFETFGAKKHRRDKAFAGNADCFIFHYRRYPYGGFDSFD